MIAVNTNVLLRLFIRDDDAQATKARALFDAHASENDAIWIADVVLAELVWMLGRSFGRPRSDIVAALRALMGSATLAIESAECLDAAIDLYERGPADFVDCLLAVKAATVGCGALHSFDKKMKGLPGVALP